MPRMQEINIQGIGLHETHNDIRITVVSRAWPWLGATRRSGDELGTEARAVSAASNIAYCASRERFSPGH